MENRNNTEKIEIRRCDLHGILAMLTLGNLKSMKSSWDAIENFIKRYKEEKDKWKLIENHIMYL